jgi:hypothetical protein
MEFHAQHHILGDALSVLGVGGLLLGDFNYFVTKTVLDVGPINIPI